MLWEELGGYTDRDKDDGRKTERLGPPSGDRERKKRREKKERGTGAKEGRKEKTEEEEDERKGRERILQ